jgi:hypothetical protein
LAINCAKRCKVLTGGRGAGREERTLVDRVVREVFALLLSGEIPLGGQLNEAALANRASKSARGPIREAVKQLQGRGLVIKEPYLKARVVSLSLPDMIEIFQLARSGRGHVGAAGDASRCPTRSWTRCSTRFPGPRLLAWGR